jgi:ankyrin repeat protein
MSLRSALPLVLLITSAWASDLSDAVKAGNHAAVARLLARKVNANVAEEDGTTPLHWAVLNNDGEVVRLLLKSGANANAATRLGVTPLFLAASAPNAAIANDLLKAGANANSVSEGGETVLMAAARTGDRQVVDQLLAHGANVQTKGSQFGETALMIAAAQNHGGVIPALVAHGADVDARSNPLSYAKDRFGLEGVVTILPHGSWTPLMYAAREGSLDALRALAEAGAHLDLADPDGTTALHLAILNAHFDAAALLIEKGADPNRADNSGMAALYAAVDMNTLGEVFGRPNRAPSGSLSALGLMKVLLDHGANPNAGLTGPALQRAHTPGEPTLAEGATPLMRAAKNGDCASIELLLAHGADPQLAQKNGTTALMFSNGLGRGVSAFAKDYASEGDLLAATKLLVAHGADVNAKSVAGLTPLHYAAQAADANFAQPSDALVLFLLEKGANVDVTDKQGRTPVDMALGKGLRGRAGGPVKPREETASLLRSLLAKKN